MPETEFRLIDPVGDSGLHEHITTHPDRERWTITHNHRHNRTSHNHNPKDMFTKGSLPK